MFDGDYSNFYRAMHFSAKRGIAIACRLSVCLSVRLSVCDVGKISSGDISATGRPIHFMFGYSVGFSGTADLMALFSIRTNSRWRPSPSWIISNGHISATAHDLLI